MPTRWKNKHIVLKKMAHSWDYTGFSDYTYYARPPRLPVHHPQKCSVAKTEFHQWLERDAQVQVVHADASSM